MRHEAVRSSNHKSLHVIFPEDGFAKLPDRIRQLGPWPGLTGGDINSLQLAEQGFVVVHQKLATFSSAPP
jgi:hypothetical protein